MSMAGLVARGFGQSKALVVINANTLQNANPQRNAEQLEEI